MLIYLSSLAQADGGATHFPRAKLSVQPRCGDALLWWNTRCDGRVDPSSAHAGEVVLSSTSKWVHCPSGCVNGPSRWTLAAGTSPGVGAHADAASQAELSGPIVVV